LYGADRAGLIGQRISRVVPHEFRDDVLALCRCAFEHGLYEDELRVPQRSPIRAAWLYRRVVRSGDGLALTVRDISEAKEHEQALTDLANSDTLTHLPNRRWLAEFLPVALARAANGNRHVALLFIDLDNFKNVNDTLGHDAGDELLQQAAPAATNLPWCWSRSTRATTWPRLRAASSLR
jgi:PleD family two-component response regulator